MTTKIGDIFGGKLKRMFEVVEPKFRADLGKRYTERATSNLEGWLKKLEGPEPKSDGQFRGWRFRQADVRPDYVIYTPATERETYFKSEASFSWEEKQAAAKVGRYSADLKKAALDADNSVTYAKQHFLLKMGKKLAKATQGRLDRPRLSGELVYSYAGIITGRLDVKYPNGDRFRVVMSIRFNRRNATYFYQFPARFTQVHIGANSILRNVSESWMSEHFK